MSNEDTAMNANAATAITTGQRDQTAKRQPPKKVNKSDIQPRKMDIQFDPAMPRYWFDNDQFKTMLLTALSCTFPEGERFFVRSVRHFQKNLTDPLLREQVKGFIGQEAHHGNEHDAFNAFMESKGVPTGKVDAYVKAVSYTHLTLPTICSV